MVHILILLLLKKLHFKQKSRYINVLSARAFIIFY